jgi:amino acid permease
MTIMKTIIGAGVLSLPFTISKLGYVLAIVIFVLVMCLSYFSTTLLIKVPLLTCRQRTYRDIATTLLSFTSCTGIGW